jgi:hypothetical protein
LPGSDMPESTGSIRDLKKQLTALFSEKAPEDALSDICRMPLLAEENMESARVVMRRLMWSLNDESGGIGWGAAEAMGEIMARNSRMADEYACILISYINPCGNFIDHPELQKGILWALGRLAQERPRHAAAAATFLIPFLSSPDPFLRGLAAWTASALPCNATKPLLIRLSSDNKMISLFVNGSICERTIGSLAQSHP